VNTIQRIAKNTFSLFASSIIGFVLSFFFLMYSTRYLGSENYGILSFSISFASIMIFLADIGIGSVIIRDIARDKSLTAKYFGNVILIKIVLAAITLVTTLVVGYAFNYQSQTMLVVYVITLSLILTSFSGIIGSFIQAFEEMEYHSLGSVIYNTTMLLCALLAISFKSDVLGFAYVYLISSIILIGYWATVSIRRIPLSRFDIDLAFWKYLIMESVPFGLSSVFVRIYYYIDTLMISLMILNPNEIMGWYNAAYRLVLILAFVPTIFLGSLYPIMSTYYDTSERYIIFMFERSFKYLMVVAIPIGVGTTVLADRIILLIYGADFSPSTIALQILVWSEVLIFLNVVFGNLLNSINQQIVVTKQTMLAAALNIVLNLVLIPKYSYVGASVATVSTELFAFCFLLFFVSKVGYSLPKYTIMSFFKALCASLIMYVFLEIFYWINLLPLILLASIIYFVVVYLLGILDKEDLYLMGQLLNGIHAHKETKDA
jgi:O-antigen/teichoic acid export membrane protein